MFDHALTIVIERNGEYGNFYGPPGYLMTPEQAKTFYVRMLAAYKAGIIWCPFYMEEIEQRSLQSL